MLEFLFMQLSILIDKTLPHPFFNKTHYFSGQCTSNCLGNLWIYFEKANKIHWYLFRKIKVFFYDGVNFAFPSKKVYNINSLYFIKNDKFYNVILIIMYVSRALKVFAVGDNLGAWLLNEKV